MTAGPILRAVQRRLLVDARKAVAKGCRRLLAVAPTAFGKTVWLALVATSHVARGGKVNVIVNRRELVAQTVKKLRAAGADRIGIVCAGEPSDPDAPIQVCMVQTMLARNVFPLATLVIIDEAHHFVADEWKRVAAHYADVLTIGLTATPERADGSPMGDIFDVLLVAATVKELTSEGLLVPCDVIAPPKKTRDLSMPVVDAWFEHATGRPTVVFARSVAEGRQHAEDFRARGVAAAFLDGETDADERKATLEAFDRGDLTVLVNVYILTEGWDSPRCEVCILARGCGSTAAYIQMVGRVLRLSPETGKTNALLLDLRGSVHDHGLPDADRVFSLEGKAISEGDAPVKTCPACSHVCAASCRTCPHCGSVFPVIDRGPDGLPLTKIGRAELEVSFFLEQLKIARLRGYKPGFAAVKFQEKFGRFPAKLWRAHVAVSSVAACLNARAAS